ncbi:MAG: YnfA family protein [Nitrospira sp. BO4]|jgi:small multidrug resistance family-3 protein|nr:YnfA family protein [Nitrospira sp. BO4]
MRIQPAPAYACIDGEEITMSPPGSLGSFVLAGLCKIGGGYLVWRSFREGHHWRYAVAGAAILILYGVIPTFQTAHFVRVHAAYGGMFIVLSLLWGWSFDGAKPDRFDVMRATICPAGMGMIMYAPRP